MNNCNNTPTTASLVYILFSATGIACQIIRQREKKKQINLNIGNFGLDEIYTVFSNEKFLLIFWLHFLSISLLVGSWITRDSIKFNIPKVLLSLSLIITYFSGPVGLVFYWFFRIFFSKKVSFND